MTSIPALRLERAILFVFAITVGFGAVSSVARGGGPPPPIPTRLIVTSVGADKIGVAWESSSNKYLYKVYLNGHEVLNSLLPPLREPKYTFERLSCGTSYDLGVSAYDRSDSTSDIAKLTAATAPCLDAQPPSAVDGLRTVSADSKSVTFAWNAASDNVGVAGYRILVSGAVVATVQTTSYTYTPALLVCGASYQIGVQAYDATGNLAPVSVGVVQAAGCGDSTPPTAPSHLRAKSVSQTGVSLEWQASTDNIRVVSYDVGAGKTAGSTTETSYNALGLECGKSYTVTVTALDAAGNRSAPTSLIVSTALCPTTASTGTTGDTKPPTSPSNILSSSAAADSITLAWTASNDDVGVAGYSVFKDGVKVGTTVVAGYQLGGLSCGTGYTVGVEAYDAAGNRSARASATVSTTPCADRTAPTAPDVQLMGKTDTTLSLGWQPATDNIGVVGYVLYKNGVRLLQTTLASYTFTGLDCGTTYTLGVASLDAAGNRSVTTNVSVATLACTSATTPPPAPTSIALSNVGGTSVTASWKSGGGSTAGFSVSLDDKVMITTATTTYTFSGLSCGTSYTFGVASYDTSGTLSAKTTIRSSTSTCSSGLGLAQVALAPNGNDSTCVRGDATRPCLTFQRAYQVAQPGDTVSVRAGTYPSNDAGRDAVTVFGNPNSGAPVTFACAGDGDVAMSGGWFTIKAFHVRVVGDCFHLTSLRIGEPGDSVVTASDVTVDSVHMQGFEAVGAQQVVLRNSEIGPNVYCYAQSANVSASAKCDPNGPGFESMWATRGTGDYPFQPYVHNNKGGVATSIVMDGNYVHDLQTKDATALHTGCGLVWQSGDFPVGQVTIRNSRFERCAVLGILFESANGVLVENNWMGPPVEPLSNANGGQEAGSFAKEIIAGSGYDKVRNWRVTGNILCHGTRAQPPAEGVVFSGNDLGKADAQWAGATYMSNTAGGGAC